MNVYTKTKGLSKFGSLEISVCGNETKKAIQIAIYYGYIHVKFKCMYMLSHM